MAIKKQTVWTSDMLARVRKVPAGEASAKPLRLLDAEIERYGRAFVSEGERQRYEDRVAAERSEHQAEHEAELFGACKADGMSTDAAMQELNDFRMRK